MRALHLRAELNTALLAPRPDQAVRALDALGRLDALLPEVGRLKMEVPEGFHHKDNFEHTLEVLKRAAELEDGDGDLVLRMAALLHDIGKPATRKFEANGEVTFHGHDTLGARLAGKRLQSLGYPPEFITKVTHLVRLHLRAFNYYPGKWSDAGVRRYMHDAGEELTRLNKLIRADATTGNARKALKLTMAMDDLERRVAAVREADRLAALKPPIGGVEVMRLTGLKPGRELGRIMNHLLALTRSGVEFSKNEARAEALRVFKEGAAS